MSKFVIRPVPTGFKFDLQAANGQSIATSEVYRTRAACLRGLESVRRCAAGKIWDTTQEAAPPSNPRFEIFRDRKELFRFRLRSRNGQIIAQSEPYTGKAACFDGIQSVMDNAPTALVIIDYQGGGE